MARFTAQDEKKKKEQQMQQGTPPIQQARVSPMQRQPMTPQNAPGQAAMPAGAPASASPGMQAGAYVQPQNVTVIGQDQVRKAMQILQKYKSGKANLELRIKSSETWWKLRHWEETQDGNLYEKRPVSAWLFNVIMGKQADAVEAYPEPNILPREEGDKAEAQKLTSILPVILEQNDFEETYSDCAWQKMKSGTAIYGVFWDKTKLNGLGDITIRKADALNLFWKPGITEIESSPNLFSVEAVDNDELIAHYPELEGKLKGNGTLTVSEYIYDDHVDKSSKSIVVDWYYKKYTNGKTLLHYCKFVNDTVLYASENIPELAERGYYDDGEYPYVFDPLFPVEGSPCGYGYIDIGKSPQESIDQLNQAIVKNAVMSATPRYFIRQDGSVNELEFADWTKPLVHVTGNMAEDALREIKITPLGGIYAQILQNKIEELKFTSGNQDVQNGTTGGGVTAASAIAALQESAGRSSKAATKSAYRAYAQIITKCIERIRQFYDMPRQFRILGQYGMEKYISYSNQAIQPQSQGMDFGLDMGYRLPVFDVQVSPQRANPYSKLSQNELALQFFQMGFFNPQLADPALTTMEMMEFEGKDSIMQKIAQGQTLMKMMMHYQQIALTLAAKYDQQMAQGIMMEAQALGIPGAVVPNQSVDTKQAQTGQENTIVSNAREKSAKAGQPE